LFDARCDGLATPVAAQAINCTFSPQTENGSFRRLLEPYGATFSWPSRNSLLRPRKRSRERVDVDITWDCNLRCFHCNRSCEQAPTKDHMTVGQIRRFLADSRERDMRWREIHIIGGEPTLHPDIDEIVRLILEYRDRHSPRTNVKLTSNGHGPKVTAVLRRLPRALTSATPARRSLPGAIRTIQSRSRNAQYAAPFSQRLCDPVGISLCPTVTTGGRWDRSFSASTPAADLALPEDDMYEDWPGSARCAASSA
jgi:hypothetical protein